MNLRKDYGYYITTKRVEQGLTMRQLSEKTGIPAMNISNIEHEKKGYSLHDLTKYLKALNIPLSEIIQGDGTLFECKRGETR